MRSKYLGLALLLVGVLFVVAQCSWAQDAAKPAAKPAVAAAGKVAPATGEAAPQAKVKKASKLTPEQEAQLKPIREKEIADTKAVRDDNTLSAEAKKEKVKAIREEARKARASILTPHQAAQYEKMIAKGRAKTKGQAGEPKKK